MNKPLTIGLTGGIGSGKSTIAKVFNSLGVPVFNSDLEAKKIIDNDSEVINAIKNEFGEVYINGALDSKRIAKIVFNDKKVLNKLNEIVHPKVKDVFDQWVELHKNEKILIKEAAILIEIGAYQELDKIILVIAPEKLRIERVVNRDGVNLKDVTRRVASQLSDEEKMKLSDYIINNDDKHLVIPQVLKIYNQLMTSLN